MMILTTTHITHNVVDPFPFLAPLITFAESP